MISQHRLDWLYAYRVAISVVIFSIALIALGLWGGGNQWFTVAPIALMANAIVNHRAMCWPRYVMHVPIGGKCSETANYIQDRNLKVARLRWGTKGLTVRFFYAEDLVTTKLSV